MDRTETRFLCYVWGSTIFPALLMETLYKIFALLHHFSVIFWRTKNELQLFWEIGSCFRHCKKIDPVKWSFLNWDGMSLSRCIKGSTVWWTLLHLLTSRHIFSVLFKCSMLSCDGSSGNKKTSFWHVKFHQSCSHKFLFTLVNITFHGSTSFIHSSW